MGTLEIWLVIAGLTFVTAATRSAFLVLADRFDLPPQLQRGLRYAPVCALIALIAPELALVDGHLALALTNPKLIAGLAAGIAALATRSMVFAMALGMAVFSLLRVFV